MGRPATRPTKFRDGYYIEVRNRNQKSGIKIHRETKELLMLAIEEYKRSKEVLVLGKWNNGKLEEIDLPELE